jgi:hypothetical protein
MFNSRQYEWADLTLMLGGVDITGFRGVKYTSKAEREPVYGKGRFPHSIQTGNFAFEGEITVLQSELEALIASGNGSILSLAVDAELTYGNAPDPTKTDRIVGIRFLEEPKEMKQGDKFSEHTLPFTCLRIDKNV